MIYRPEIDGLRALAVIPVILFHAGFEIFGGGFVGVDIFFVISGYLITTILIEDLDNNQFSILNFYKRRARRILPALFFVIIICIPFSWAWMLPDQLLDFSQSLIAVSLFTSNILFWRESGYFDLASEEKPLLHTWSLAVEEQYYLLFPIFLILVWHLGKNRVFWIIFILALISFLLSEWGSRTYSVANFYLAPTRAWELFTGSISAFIVQKKGIQKNNTLAFFGLAAIILSIFIYDKNTPFPSAYTLIPVLGTMLLILYADKETFVAELLSTRIIVGIGLISYSSYLWHQPLFAFARIRSISSPTEELMLVLVLVSFIVGFISWKYIENPFRYNLYLKKITFRLSFIAIALPFIIGILIFYKVDASTPKVDASTPLVGKSCLNFPAVGSAKCVTTDKKDKDLHVLIWGDSHAASLRKDVIIPDYVRITIIDHSGCAPILGLFRFDKATNMTNCNNSNTMLGYAEYINKLNPDVVILSSRWAMYLNGWKRKGVLLKAHHFLTDSVANIHKVKQSAQFRANLIEEGLYKTLDYLNAKKTFILISPPDLADIGMNKQIRNIGTIPYSYISAYNKAADVLFKNKNEFNVINSKNYFCEKSSCNIFKNGNALYEDDGNHVTSYGSRIIWQEIFMKEVYKKRK